jgi:outer membrane lipoprotein-sorting protein
VSDNHASGYNVHKGLTRNISGTIEATADGLHLQLAEPGNNQYDGKFDFIIDTTNWMARGYWTPFKKGEEAAFQLKKKVVLKEEEQWDMIFTDTLQNYITLKPDGSCSYTYLADTTNTGQEHTIRGNYTREKGKVTVYWQKNNVFPQKSVFTLIETKPYKDEDYIEKTLKGEGRVFSQLWD